MSKAATAKKRVQAPRRAPGRAGIALTAIDFGPEYWVIVKGAPADTAAKLAQTVSGLAEFVRFDGTPVFINPNCVKAVGVPS